MTENTITNVAPQPHSASSNIPELIACSLCEYGNEDDGDQEEPRAEPEGGSHDQAAMIQMPATTPSPNPMNSQGITAQPPAVAQSSPP